MAAPKKYRDELRERAARLALESGRPIAHVAQELGVHKDALRTWVRQARADAAGGTPTVLSSARCAQVLEVLMRSLISQVAIRGVAQDRR
jgi:transposase-like protein